jgi:hypothetical protein
MARAFEVHAGSCWSLPCSLHGFCLPFFHSQSAAFEIEDNEGEKRFCRSETSLYRNTWEGCPESYLQAARRSSKLCGQQVTREDLEVVKWLAGGCLAGQLTDSFAELYFRLESKAGRAQSHNTPKLFEQLQMLG